MEFPNLLESLPEPTVAFHAEGLDFVLPTSVETGLLARLQVLAQEENAPLSELNYVFCSDDRLREINVEFLQHDYYTDIITFPYAENALYGDIFISLDRVEDNARQLGVSFEQELMRVMLHGALHLAGYHDKTKAQQAKMRAREDYYLSI